MCHTWSIVTVCDDDDRVQGLCLAFLFISDICSVNISRQDGGQGWIAASLLPSPLASPSLIFLWYFGVFLLYISTFQCSLHLAVEDFGRDCVKRRLKKLCLEDRPRIHLLFNVYSISSALLSNVQTDEPEAWVNTFRLHRDVCPCQWLWCRHLVQRVEIREKQVLELFQRVQIRKASGPDGICYKTWCFCAHQLGDIFHAPSVLLLNVSVCKWLKLSEPWTHESAWPIWICCGIFVSWCCSKLPSGNNKAWSFYLYFSFSTEGIRVPSDGTNTTQSRYFAKLFCFVELLA